MGLQCTDVIYESDLSHLGQINATLGHPHTTLYPVNYRVSTVFTMSLGLVPKNVGCELYDERNAKIYHLSDHGLDL